MASAMPAQPTEFGLELGGRLRAARLALGLSTRQVATMSAGRWSAAAIANYERGDRCVSVKTLVELSRLYHVPAALLLPDPTVRTEGPEWHYIVDMDRDGTGILRKYFGSGIAGHRSVTVLTRFQLEQLSVLSGLDIETLIWKVGARPVGTSPNSETTRPAPAVKNDNSST